MTTLTARAEARGEINVTPLIDVLLVLLIVFMIITPLTPAGLRADVPQPAPLHSQPSEAAIVLQLMGDGTLRINTHKIRSGDLRSEVSQLFFQRADKALFIEADQGIEYRQVAHLIDELKGIDPSIRVGLITSNAGVN
jgi:biopolymer transport protein TolR